mgnify:CR=1 FL=1
MSVAPAFAPVCLDVYRTNVGIFVKSLWNGYYNSSCKINGILCTEGIQKTGGFIYFPTILAIETITRKTPGVVKLVGHKLKNPTCECEALPLHLGPDAIEVEIDDDENTILSGPYADRAAMYEVVTETTEPVWENVPFTVRELGYFEVDKINDPVNMSVCMKQDTLSYKDTAVVDLKDIVTYEEIERLLVPEFLIHERPCHLSSHQMYKIVRAYVHDNHNRECAAITSDYDFCFTVKRRVKKAKPLERKTEVLTKGNRSYKPPRFSTTKVEDTYNEIFEMTYAEYKNGGYEKYTPIAPLYANNLAELATFLKQYLDDLMEVINTKATECPHCEGHGIIVTRFNTNPKKDIS